MSQFKPSPSSSSRLPEDDPGSDQQEDFLLLVWVGGEWWSPLFFSFFKKGPACVRVVLFRRNRISPPPLYVHFLKLWQGRERVFRRYTLQNDLVGSGLTLIPEVGEEPHPVIDDGVISMDDDIQNNDLPYSQVHCLSMYIITHDYDYNNIADPVLKHTHTLHRLSTRINNRTSWAWPRLLRWKQLKASLYHITIEWASKSKKRWGERGWTGSLICLFFPKFDSARSLFPYNIALRFLLVVVVVVWCPFL